MPPPHPTSRTSRHARTRLGSDIRVDSGSSCSFSRMKRIRCAFILCRRANSPRSSHQSAERREKWAISASLTVEKCGCSSRYRDEVRRVRGCCRRRGCARIEKRRRGWFRRGSISWLLGCLYLLAQQALCRKCFSSSQPFPSLFLRLHCQFTVLPQGLTDRILPICCESGCDLSSFVNDRTRTI